MLPRTIWLEFRHYLEWYGVIVGVPAVFLLLIVAYIYVKDRNKRL